MNALSSEQLVAQMRWRYATRKFDRAKKVPDKDWAALEEVLVLTPSSIGLQPWKFIVVTDQAVKDRLAVAAWNQAQPADCSHFVVFAVHRDLGTEHVDRHVARMGEVRGQPTEALGKFREMVIRNVDKERASGRLDTWQTHQLYIALGNFMTAAAMLGVDTCPMEGFEPAEFDKILGLEGTAFATVVSCAAGYRAADDRFATMTKVRFKPEDVIVRV
ncbi:NAD(P)H-dependent oxidoreductase [Horticoccus luteus]|uniref:NAD(P)H-dependent oxidoreductase n=1 Tax=Horticoccus luteus TaxID=2862869 RepID=A0A8F9XMB4_9BACT|nr:NAD(P)H-dependent oxidoreductase [Horticoccus luteus]QYM79869.1 NAD(P)H-dependent oxidoreductase [Horticoccus luteus]